MGPPLVIGVDSSTQSTKAEARELGSGERVGTGRCEHPATSPPRSEQDPQAWWDALVQAVGQLGELRGDVVAISIGGQQHGLVVCAGDGTPLRPAKLWNDTESAAEAEAMVSRLGAERWAQLCGSVPVSAFTVTKLAWLVDHEPGLLGAVGAVCLPHDWLTWRLCGRLVTDRGDASGTGWFDLAGDRPTLRRELLAEAVRAAPGELGDPAHWAPLMPAVLGPAEPAGVLTEGAAAALGLGSDVVVGPGTGDNMAAALGLGLADGDVAVSLGTSGTVYSVASHPTRDASGAVAGFADATGRFLPLVCTLNATKVTDTVASWLGLSPDELARLALSADPHGPGRPTLVPYFDGERTPDLPDATGTLAGLRNDTTREDLALAAHDGVLGGLLAGLDALHAAGVDVAGRLFLVGGGAHSAAYRQRLADLTGRTVRVPDADEAVATGAALQAAVVVGESGTGDPARPASADLFAARQGAWGLGAGSDVSPR